jgi:hypothetical protein
MASSGSGHSARGAKRLTTGTSLTPTEAAAPAVTFGEAFAAWLPTADVRDSTRRTYRHTYRKHMEATLAKLSVADVAAETSHVAGVARGSSARCMVSIAIQVCASVKVPVNNMRRGAVRVSHKTKVREHIPFDSDMQAAIVAYLGKRGILARVMYETGCRASEALALCGADFHANGDAYSVSITQAARAGYGRERCSQGRSQDPDRSGVGSAVPGCVGNRGRARV